MLTILNTSLIGISAGAIYSLMALSLVLVWRSTRVVNFAQAGQAILSTYIGYEVINRTHNYWLALPVALVAGAIIGALVDALLIRSLTKRSANGPLAAIAPIIATLGLLGLIRSAVGMIWTNDLKPFNAPVSNHGFTFGTTTIPFSRYNLLIVITTIVVMIVFTIIFQKTSLGLALRAAAFQPETARLAGVKVDRIRTVGWAFAGATGAVAGVLITPQSGLSPNSLDSLLIYGFVAAVIGGLESLIGAAVGGMVLGIGLAFIREYVNSNLEFPSTFVILLLVLLIKPGGIIAARRGRSA
jgi:branched-chain amino acid transport system permease protein